MLLRAPVLARDRAAVTWGAPAGAAARDQAALLGYLGRLAAEPVLVEAVALASPSLSGQWRRALTGEPLPVRNLGRMAVSLTRYALRAAHRSTPFGVMAGVGLASFGGPGRARFGGGHRRAVRPDWGWLARAVAGWEQDAAILPELKVVANTLCEVRGERLVVPFTARPPHPGAGQGGGGADEDCRRTTLRRTPAVEAAMREAAYPVTAGELARRVLAAFPGVPEGSVSALIRQLVGAEALLTELRPPLDGTDPLAHLLRVLPPGSAAKARRQVAELRRAAADYASRPLGGGTPVATVADRPVRLQADLELDADVVLPRAVAAEAEHAAELLRSLSPPAPGPLAAYHRRFVERYGTECLVPLGELLDPGTGLGPPPGYRMPPGPADIAEPAAAAPSRGWGADADAALLAAFGQAIAEGRREIELDDALLGRLTVEDTAPGPEGAVELYAQVVADSVAAMAAGDFTLLLADHTSPLAGAGTGRFGHLFAGRARPLARESAAVSAGSGALAVRIAHPVSQQRFAHVAQVPRWLDHDLLAGVYGDPSSDRAIPLTDVEIGADRHGFLVVSRSTGRRLAPLAFHHLNRQAGMPNAVRFLLEAPHVRLPRWRPWDWGPLARAPFLPAVRRGRTVLSAARWRVSGPQLSGGDARPASWEAAFDRFRSRWAVPDDVELVASDQCVPLHLPAPAHRELLWAELRSHGEALLREPAYGGDLGRGWLRDADGGVHSAEVVISLLPVRPLRAPGRVDAPPRTATASPLAAALPPPRGRASAAHPPGGRWLYARLPCPQDRQDHVLTAHLAPLVRQLPESVDRWFFLRYRDTDHHLRLRFHGDRDALYGGVLPGLHALAGRLSEQGLTGGLSLVTYEPETERYGGPAALPLAERVFRADSETVLRALAAGTGGADPVLDAAAEVAAMARAFLPPDPAVWTRWLLAAYPVRREHRAAFTARRRAALERITAGQDGGCPPELLGLLAEYGRLVRRTAQDASWLDPGKVLVSLLHMHCNRRLGVDPRAEPGVHAIVGGAVRAHRDRDRAPAVR